MCNVQEMNYFDNNEVSLFAISCKNEPIKEKVFIHDQLYFMELDTGAENNVISEKMYKGFFFNYKLYDQTILLNSDIIHHLGTCNVNVRFKNIKKTIPFLVTMSSGPPLFGRNFLSSFEIKLN